MRPEDFEKKNMDSSNNSTDDREITRTSSTYAGNATSGIRSQRPRIHVQRAYTPNGNAANRMNSGYRSEGVGNTQNTPQGERTMRPHTGNFRVSYDADAQRRTYQPRTQNNTYGQRAQGYQSRPRYNAEGGNANRPQYGNRPQGSGYQQRAQGYQPRPQGYQPRQGGYQPRQGGYQQRPQQGSGYGQPRQGYGQRPQQGGYNPHMRTGYAPRQQGGYQQRTNYRQHTPGYDPNAKYSLKKRIEYKETHIDPNAPIRLNKFLANAGVCSRREADEFIQAGVVTVNGQVVTELGTKITRADEVKFHDAPITLEKKVYVLLNKPKDYVTTSDDPQQRKTVMDLVRDSCSERIYPVGRLDRNTTGVLLFTNDGDLASKLTHPKFLKKKVYHVFLDKDLSDEDMQRIAEGIELEDGEIHADSIAFPDEADKAQVGIEIHSGRNRIVRRIFEHLGYRVMRLDRVQFAGLTKKNLRRGDWRYLTQQEVEMLRTGMFE